MKPVRILHLVATMNPEIGGLSEAVRVLISGLNKLSTYNEVMSVDTPEAPYIAHDLFHVHALGPGKSSWFYSDKLLSWMVENISSFDMVILHGLWVYNGYALSKTLRLLKANSLRHAHKNLATPKIFIMPHGMLDPYFQVAAGRKLKAIRNWAYWKLIENKIVNEADGLLFTCEEEKRLARKPFKPYSPRQEYVVGLGISDPPECNHRMQKAFLQKCPELKDQSYLLFLSRIHPKKGVDLLINAYAELYNNARMGSVVDSSYGTFDNKRSLPKLVIAGPNLESSYGQKILKMANQNTELKNMIYFPGMLSGDAKWGALYNCEAFVLASHQENFGIAVVEALACKRPVLISNEVNIWKEIKGTGGGLVHDDTIEGTIELLKNWTQLPPTQKNIMGKQARKTFEQYFSIASASMRIREALDFSLI